MDVKLSPLILEDEHILIFLESKKMIIFGCKREEVMEGGGSYIVKIFTVYALHVMLRQ
jgi:hypothetical protein